jgi:hypothetical protein
MRTNNNILTKTETETQFEQKEEFPKEKREQIQTK